MATKDIITEDMKSAMKSKNKVKTSVLRMILSEMKYAAAAKDASIELSEEDAIAVVKSYHKRLTKSLADYPEGEKQDQIKAEIEIVACYLPKMASEEEILAVIDEILKNHENPQFGQLMKEVIEKLSGNADGKLVSSLVKSRLS